MDVQDSSLAPLAQHYLWVLDGPLKFLWGVSPRKTNINKSPWSRNAPIFFVGFCLLSVIKMTDDMIYRRQECAWQCLSVIAEGGEVQSHCVVHVLYPDAHPVAFSLPHSCTLIFCHKQTKNKCEHNQSVLITVYNSSTSQCMVPVFSPIFQERLCDSLLKLCDRRDSLQNLLKCPGGLK